MKEAMTAIPRIRAGQTCLVHPVGESARNQEKNAKEVKKNRIKNNRKAAVYFKKSVSGAMT